MGLTATDDGMHLPQTRAVCNQAKKEARHQKRDLPPQRYPNGGYRPFILSSLQLLSSLITLGAFLLDFLTQLAGQLVYPRLQSRNPTIMLVRHTSQPLHFLFNR